MLVKLMFSDLPFPTYSYETLLPVLLSMWTAFCVLRVRPHCAPGVLSFVSLSNSWRAVPFRRASFSWGFTTLRGVRFKFLRYSAEVQV